MKIAAMKIEETTIGELKRRQCVEVKANELHVNELKTIRILLYLIMNSVQ